MENKHIQNNRNENNKKNDTTEKIGKIYIQENEYIKIEIIFTIRKIFKEMYTMTVHIKKDILISMRNCQNINILVNQKSHQ